jgi:UrcA family protein
LCDARGAQRALSRCNHRHVTPQSRFIVIKRARQPRGVARCVIEIKETKDEENAYCYCACTCQRYDTRPHIDVPYSDLNLGNPTGAKAMLRRIAKAAELVCGGRPDMREMSDRSVFKTCVRVAVADAVGQLNAPLVTALHEGRDPADPRQANVRVYGSR